VAVSRQSQVKLRSRATVEMCFLSKVCFQQGNWSVRPAATLAGRATTVKPTVAWCMAVDIGERRRRLGSGVCTSNSVCAAEAHDHAASGVKSVGERSDVEFGSDSAGGERERIVNVVSFVE
jgi:hypothetical protein